jgi:hypothetical protein
VLLGIGLCVSGLLAELVVRWTIGEQVKFPRYVVAADWGLRRNAPGARYRHDSADVTVWFQINQQGMRADRDYSYRKPAGVHRIVSLGDSFTLGYEVSGDQTFSAVLERELEAMGCNVEVLNAGVSGFSTAEAYLYLERELWNYDPDIVLVSFFVNDLVDNVRTNLFALHGGELVPKATAYVPGGTRLGDFLNTNPLLNWFSERSDAFAFFKERLTLLTKRRMVQENLRNLDFEQTAKLPADQDYERALTVAIFEKMYEATRRRGVPLVIQSIPAGDPERPRLIDRFPADFDTDRPGIVFFRSAEVLGSFLGKELLYWRRSHHHWTPFSHRKSGEGLATAIARRGLLECE